jgi:hypothetical protein
VSHSPLGRLAPDPAFATHGNGKASPLAGKLLSGTLARLAIPDPASTSGGGGGGGNSSLSAASTGTSVSTLAFASRPLVRLIYSSFCSFFLCFL